MVGLSLTTGFPLGARLTSALLLNILQPKKELSPEEVLAVFYRFSKFFAADFSGIDGGL